jgi:DNA-binding transcriptional MerR regulator
MVASPAADARAHTRKIYAMRTVTVVARHYGVSPDAVRHYTKLGLLNPLRSEINGYRYFDIAEANKLGFILSAKKLGFSLKEIGQILVTADHGDTPCPLVRELIQRRLGEIREEIAESQRLANRLELACDRWRELPDRMPSGDSICHLIETWQAGVIDPEIKPEDRDEKPQ